LLVVSRSHFGGAMENKSLNIFSTGLIVATP
jgi:aminopeptidase N